MGPAKESKSDDADARDPAPSEATPCFQIQEKLLQLQEQKEEMLLRRDDRWDWLRLRE